jgi:exopolysaccharide biosynthesis polyprenyl glycosylphosphotransferase
MQVLVTSPTSLTPSPNPGAVVRTQIEQLVQSGRDLGTKAPSRSSWAHRYRNLLVASDIFIVTASVLVSLLARFGPDPDASVQLAGLSIGYWAVAAIIIVTWLFVIGAYRTRDARVVGVGATEYKRVVSASLLAFGLLAIAFLVFKVDIARGFFVVAFPLGLVALTASRWGLRRWLTSQRLKGHYLSQAIVVGKRRDVEYVIRQIVRKSGAAYQIVGVAVEKGNHRTLTVDGMTVPVVGTPLDVAGAARSSAADVVIVAGQPTGGSQFIRNLGWELETTRAELVLASRLTNVAGPRIHFRPVEGLPLMHVELPQFEGGKHILKRAFDFSVAAVILTILLPFMAAIAIMIKADSPGPALIKQERIGRNGTIFYMYKFRSMVVTAAADLEALLEKNEGAGNVIFKMKDDPRITKLGKVLRRYSLDEFPQLFNVLLGNMSLVGPRPHFAREVEQYESHVNRRLFIKPGLTGMWQVNGRSNLSWEESVTLDLYYVENWSLTGDLVILWRTVEAMRNPTGAY